MCGTIWRSRVGRRGRTGTEGSCVEDDTSSTERQRRQVFPPGPRAHPRGMGDCEVARFLEHLAVGQHAAASTQNQALAALLFLYGDEVRLVLDALRGPPRHHHPRGKRRPRPPLGCGAPPPSASVRAAARRHRSRRSRIEWTTRCGSFARHFLGHKSVSAYFPDTYAVRLQNSRA